MKRLIALPLCAGLFLTACSGTGGGSPASSTEASVEAEASSDESKASAEASVKPDDPLGFGNEDATAKVTIGDQTFEFGNLYCVTLGGALGAVSVGGDPKVDISIPPENWESSGEDWPPPSVQVSSDEPYFTYDADAELSDQMTNVEPGQSQVDSFSTDGYHASGTATFFDAFADVSGTPQEPISGTFEVTCPRP